MTKSGIIAVITGDLVNSSQFEPQRMAAIIVRLNSEFERLRTDYSDDTVNFSMYRGDSFQGIVEDVHTALTIAIRLKALVNSFTDSYSQPGNKTPIADVRISIGIGEGNYDPNAIHISNGEAFQLSGRTLDTMKQHNLKMCLTTPSKELNDEFMVHMNFLDGVTDRWSIASAEVVYYLLRNYKEQDIAKALNRSQAAINLRKKAAGWDEIKSLLHRFAQVIKKPI
jgi:hypothetical protein